MGPYGVHWDRTETWWPMVSAYHRYLARCQFVLRQGTPVADICYLVPEGAPQVFRPPASALEGELPERRGYTFDGCAPETLLEEARVENGLLTFPSGAAYRLLVLPACETMRPALLRKVKELVEAGATVVGTPPRKSPSLTDYPACDEEVQSLAAELWGGMQPPSKAVERKFGAGRIVWGGELEARRQDTPMSRTIEQARWIWDPEVDFAAAMPDKRYFRGAVQVEPNRRIRSARVWATADNEFALDVNGKPALRGNNFHTLYTKEVRELLEAGENVLAVDVLNRGDGPNPAGLVAALLGEYEDGGTFTVVTDAQWQVARKAEGPATSMEPSDDWKQAQELGPIGMEPWRLDASQGRANELYPEYEATALVLSNMNVQPDFESEDPIRYTHRRTESADVYFVANRTADFAGGTCSFRVSGRRPELWDPLNGTRRALPVYNEENGRTSMALRFEPYQSWFVVFRDESEQGQETRRVRYNFDIPRLLGFVDGVWDVSFDPANGGPGDVRFENLCDWRERTEPGIRYYSGVARYRKTFELPESVFTNGASILLDLGEVHCMARVRVNDRDAGVAWCDPWRVEITDAAKAGENRLEIEVANLWPNRLIADSGLPEKERVTWTTWNPYKPDSLLLPSGLLGPVQILSAE